jgi:hypothetical protein
MTDFVRADPLAAGAAAATATLAQLEADHHAAPEQQLVRARERQALLPNDATRHLAAAAEIAALEAKVAGNEAPSLMSDEQRLDQALGGQIDFLGAEVTAGDQIPTRDFNAAIAADLALGIRPELIRSFYLTGKSGEPDGHIHAATWLRMYENSPEMQRLHREGDPVICRRFRYACIYLAGAHEPA